MRKILLAVLMAVSFAASASAGNFGNFVPFSNLSTANTTTYSSAVNVRNFPNKTVTADFTTGTATGTVLIQCAPSATGPWTTCNQEDATAITGTGTYLLSWKDASAYIRASWARTTGRIYVWLNYNE